MLRYETKQNMEQTGVNAVGNNTERGQLSALQYAYFERNSTNNEKEGPQEQALTPGLTKTQNDRQQKQREGA